MIEFLKDVYVIFAKTLKEYYRWKLHFVYDSVFPLLDGFLYIVIWGAILASGVAVGILRPDNYIAFLLSGLILWNFAARLCHATRKFFSSSLSTKNNAGRSSTCSPPE